MNLKDAGIYDMINIFKGERQMLMGLHREVLLIQTQD